MSPILYFLIAIVAFTLMVVGMSFCDRVAERRSWNIWIARMVGLLLPVVGLVIYWILDRTSRTTPGQPM